MSKPLIAVFGATGAQGGGLVRALLGPRERPFRVRAITRKPGGTAAHELWDLGAEIFAADLDDPASVQRAMHGAYGAFCVTSYSEYLSPERELAHADAMAEAARRAGVRHVVWSTLEDTRNVVPADGSAMPVLRGRYNVPQHDAKAEADRYFVARGLPLTRLLTSFQWENLIRCGLHLQRRGDGRLAFVLPTGETPLAGIAADDIGACAAALFRLGDAAIGRTIGIAAEHLTGAQMAATLARVLGEPVEHVAPEPGDCALLGLAGAEELANLFRFQRDFAAGYRALRDVAATRALHPGLATFDGWLRANMDRLPVGARRCVERAQAQ